MTIKGYASISKRVVRQTAEVNQGGVKIDQAYGMTAFLPLVSSIGRPDDQRDARGFVPDGPFHYLILFPHVEAMVAAVSDDMVDALVLAGTPDEVREQAEAFRGLVDNLILYAPTFFVETDQTRAAHANMIAAFAD